MDTSTLVLIEGGLIFGAILLLAFRELWSLRRDRLAERGAEEPPGTEAVSTTAVSTDAVARPSLSDASGASGTAASPAPPDGRSA